jgi:outer membrane protein assembly factor BamB
MRTFSPLLVALALAGAGIANADCTGGTCIPGGGPTKSDCTAEFFGTGLLLNYPPYDPAKPKPKKELRCYDGDAGCDSDGALDGVCTFNVNVCLAAADAALPDCSVASVATASVKAKGADAGALDAAVEALLPAQAAVCTTGQTIGVALKPTKKGKLKDGRASVKVAADGSAGKEKDTLKLRCMRRDWPSHGFNHANHRATPYETQIGVDNVATVEVAWEFPVDEQDDQQGAAGVTATPTMGHGLLFVPAWDGTLYALVPKTGKVKWKFAAPGSIGIQSSASVTADGRVLFVDGLQNVHCLDAKTGKLLWKTSVKEIAADHVWASPAVANNRVIIGVAALADSPAAPGRLVALDLDTGAELWERRMVAENICTTDTSIACADSGECPEGGECITGLGAGVIATVAIDATGENVYANTVGSFTFPAIGDTDSMMRLDAATGDTLWINQVTPDEQFGACAGDTSIECGTDTMCGADGPCNTKSFYHDFGFVNGPLIVTGADDGAGGTRDLIVSGSKDGSLYAFDPETGDIVWRNEILPVPVTPGFAGWGLFNGAVAFTGGRFFAALDGHAATTPVPPLHLQAFSVVDGSTVWDDEIDNSWSHVDVANGVLFAGPKDEGIVYAYDAETGTRLHTFEFPAPSAGGAIVVDGLLVIPYGIFEPVGGVRAYRLP